METHRSIGSMLEMIHGLAETSELTPWEESFVKSVWAHSFEAKKTSSLSEKQIEHIGNIWRRHFA